MDLVPLAREDVWSLYLGVLEDKELYSRLSLSQSRRDSLEHLEISVFRHIRCAELRKIPIEQPNFSNRTTKFLK